MHIKKKGPKVKRLNFKFIKLQLILLIKVRPNKKSFLRSPITSKLEAIQNTKLFVIGILQNSELSLIRIGLNLELSSIRIILGLIFK